MRAAVLLVAALLALGGCGDDGGGQSTQAERNAGTTEGQAGQDAPAGGGGGARSQEPASEARPSRRDVEVVRRLERHLRQQAAVESGGWTFADVEDVQVQGTSVLIKTDLRPARRDAAASLCLTTRDFFLEGGQGQTPYQTVVTSRDGAALGRC